MGHKILPLSIIEKKKVDTAIIASIRYGDEIIKKFKESYPCVQYVMRLEGLIGGLEIKDIKNKIATIGKP